MSFHCPPLPLVTSAGARPMCSADLPDVIVLGQRDPTLRAMGKAAEDYLYTLLREAPYFGQVYERLGLIDAFSVIRIDKKRFTYLSFVFRDPEAGIGLLEHRLTRLTNKRRFADLRIELSNESAAILTWAARKNALIRSCGRDSGHITVTLSRPQIASREGITLEGGGA